MMRMGRNRNSGFTLAELLIVVAIIAVLVAIAIPVLNTQIEAAREAHDVDMLRQAYSAAILCQNAEQFDDGVAIRDPAKSDSAWYGYYNPTTGEVISQYTYNSSAYASKRSQCQVAKPLARRKGWQGKKPDWDNFIYYETGFNSYDGIPLGIGFSQLSEAQMNSMSVIKVHFGGDKKVRQIFFQ
jgi:prepilin-type N-terminal cleavage/methylation domain-containing protein